MHDLADHVRNGGSVIVAAAESGAGKSTLAHTLIDCIRPGKDHIYIRGTYEPFDWLDEYPLETTALLVNEFSPHLPVYCWGESAGRTLELHASGFQLIATMHASNRAEALVHLSRLPISSPPGSLDRLLIFVIANTTERETRK
jgi:type IV secretory pathway ATPase VirB11/archaellum biosynthesis ATPase